jgi:hypothetical protein
VYIDDELGKFSLSPSTASVWFVLTHRIYVSNDANVARVLELDIMLAKTGTDVKSSARVAYARGERGITIEALKTSAAS